MYALFLMSLSCLAGVLGGITGTGGILIPPVLVEMFGVSPHVAMGSAQASYIIPCAVAVLMFLRKGQFDWRISAPLALSGSICTFVSAQWIKPVLDGAVLSLLLALCIVASGMFMLRPVGQRPGKTVPPVNRKPVLLVLGGIVGLIAGVTGSGGNAILVPALVACGFPILEVLAACQAYSILVASFGTIGNMTHHVVDWYVVVWLVLGQIVGIWLGVMLAQRMNTNLLKRLVGLVCLGVGLFVIIKSLALLGL